MIPKFQNKFYPNGNCFPASIASLIEMEVDDVIQIQEYYKSGCDWGQILKDWLKEKGYEILPANEFMVFHLDLNHIYQSEKEIEEDIKQLKDEYYMVSGKSPRYENESHIVIYQNGKLVHDPHPDNTGILSIDGFLKIIKLN